MLLCTTSGGNSNPTLPSMGENLRETLSNSLATEPSAAVVGAAAVVPNGWTAVTVSDEDGSKSKRVMIRDGTTDAEVRLHVYR